MHKMKKFLLILAIAATGAQAQTTYMQSATVVQVAPKVEYQIVPQTQQTCQTVEVPVYRTTTNRGSDNLGSFIVGAVIGNAIGKATGIEHGQAIGGIIGGVAANEHQKQQNTTSTNEIVGYRQEQRCTVTQTTSRSQERVTGSYVTVEFNGMRLSYDTTDTNIRPGDTVRIRVALSK